MQNLYVKLLPTSFIFINSQMCHILREGIFNSKCFSNHSSIFFLFIPFIPFINFPRIFPASDYLHRNPSIGNYGLWSISWYSKLSICIVWVTEHISRCGSFLNLVCPFLNLVYSFWILNSGLYFFAIKHNKYAAAHEHRIVLFSSF